MATSLGLGLLSERGGGVSEVLSTELLCHGGELEHQRRWDL